MNYRIFILCLLIIFSCKKNQKNDKLSIKEITNLKNYKVERTKINDTIEKIVGQNSDYSISGNLNTKTKKKDGWWKISNKRLKESFEIEYLFIKPENFN